MSSARATARLPQQEDETCCRILNNTIIYATSVGSLSHTRVIVFFQFEVQTVFPRAVLESQSYNIIMHKKLTAETRRTERHRRLSS